MLRVIRKIFDFGDWARSHPTEPPPGDMLDAQFEEIFRHLDRRDERIDAALRHDGVVANGAVQESSLSADLRRNLTAELQNAVKTDVETVRSALKAAESAKKDTQTALKKAQQAAGQVKQAADTVSGARDIALEQLTSAIATAEALIRRIDQVTPFLTNAQNDAKLAENTAYDWAVVSNDWAEHMPDTIPPNTLKMMDISGEHWSARWWANRADNAFGRLTDLYLGAWPEPPTTNLEGGPIQVGSIYYNTETGQTYVWDGTSWNALWAPQRAATAHLTYVAATDGVTAINLTTMDVNGDTFALNQSQPEGLEVHINGVQLVQTLGGGFGDYTIDVPTSTVTLSRPLRAEDVALIDILVPVDQLRPGAVAVYALNDITPKDGVTKIFNLSIKNPNTGIPVAVQRPEELLVSVDGSIQQPGVNYQASLATITFTEAPLADSVVFITWYQSVPLP